MGDFSSRLCTIRELYEETNILLSSTSNSNLVAKESTSSGRWFLDYCKSNGIQPDISNLIPFSRWITPVVKINTASRYDTTFYITEVTHDKIQDVTINNDELSLLDWYSPTDAIEDYYKDIIQLAPPTFVKIQQMKQFEKLDDLLDYSKQKEVKPILPELSIKDGVNEITLPYYDPETGTTTSKVRAMVGKSGKCTLTSGFETLKSWL